MLHKMYSVVFLVGAIARLMFFIGTPLGDHESFVTLRKKAGEKRGVIREDSQGVIRVAASARKRSSRSLRRPLGLLLPFTLAINTVPN